jgi:hypothetical protein
MRRSVLDRISKRRTHFLPSEAGEVAEGRRGRTLAVQADMTPPPLRGTSPTSLGRRRGSLDKYSLLKGLWKRLSVGRNRHLVPAEGFGLVERVIGSSDRGAKITLLQRSGPDADGYLEHLATDLDRQPSKSRADTFCDTPAFAHIDTGQDGGEFLRQLPVRR